MAEAREFKPLKELGRLALSESSELVFYVDEYKGHRYGSIRTFVKGEGYSGPTKSGVTLNGRVLDAAIEAIGKLPPEPLATEDQELARIPKKAGVELVVRVTIFKDSTGVDIREWVDEPEYKGWSKKGVRIPYKDIPASLQFLRQMKALVAKP